MTPASRPVRRAGFDAPRALCLAWIGVVILATLWPLPDRGAGPPAARGAIAGLGDIGRNVVLYAPLGVALVLTGRRPAVATAVGFLLASLVELMQLGVPGRDPSFADVTVDAAAVAVGALAAQRARGGARRERGRFAFAAGAVGALALLAPGFVSRTVPYEGPYYPTWAHEPPPYARLPGRVESAQLAGIPLPSNSRQAEWAPFGSRWASGAPLEVRAFLDRWPDELAPLVKVNGEKVELLLLAVEERDLVVREHRAGERLGLEMPLFAARDALARVGKGAAFELELRRSGLGWSARLDDGATLALGPTPGSAWRFWIRADDVSERTRRAGDAVTVGLVFAVVGFSLSRSWTGALGLVLPLAALLVSPPLLGLVATPPREWIAAGAGFALGALLRRAAGAGQRGAIGPT